MMYYELLKSAPPSPALRLDARTKLFLLLAINIMTIGSGNDRTAFYLRTVLAAIFLILMLASKKTKVSLLYGGFYLLALYVNQRFMHSTKGVANIMIFVFVSILLRFFPGALMGYYLITTTLVSELIASLERMHITQKVIIPLAVMFRFIPTVGEESQAISDAMRMRGVGIRNFTKRPTAMLEYRLVPLMMSVVKIGNGLSAAALTRGLGSPGKRTNICKIGFGLWDVVFAVSVTIAMGFYIIF